jgi:ribonuclease P protein component
MINRRHRFHGYGSLRHVYNHGQLIRGPQFSVRVLANPKRDSYRLAVVVSRKVSKSAVTRNRLRRRLYEAVRQMETEVGPVDIVINLFNDHLLAETLPNLSRQLKSQLKKAGAIPRQAPR